MDISSESWNPNVGTSAHSASTASKARAQRDLPVLNEVGAGNWHQIWIQTAILGSQLDNVKIPMARDFGASVMLSVVVFLFCGDSWAAGATLRVGGFYRTTKLAGGNRYYKYIEFFQNGSVIGVSTTGSPSEIRGWFVPGNPNVASGTYVLDGEHISFYLRYASGAVNYTGHVGARGLDLRASGESSVQDGIETYEYIGLQYTSYRVPQNLPQQGQFAFRSDADRSVSVKRPPRLRDVASVSSLRRLAISRIPVL